MARTPAFSDDLGPVMRLISFLERSLS